MYDLYAPLVKDPFKEISWSEAKEMMFRALRPLGDEYLSVVREGLESGWTDVFPNKGKRSGAYSWGSYATHPYIMMNYTNNLNDVSTLVHEMGHSMHSYYSRKRQPYPTADYCIFTAEVASTTNEVLFLNDLIAETKDRKKRLYLLNRRLENIRTTVYRQTMFASFEREVHDRAADGRDTTPDGLRELWYELNRKYYGPDIVIDDEIRMVKDTTLQSILCLSVRDRLLGSNCPGQLILERADRQETGTLSSFNGRLRLSDRTSEKRRCRYELPEPVKEVVKYLPKLWTKWKSCFSSFKRSGYAVDTVSVFCFGSLLHARAKYHTMNTAGYLDSENNPLMTGMTAGLFAVMMLNAVGNLFIGAYIPKVLPYLRLIGAAYLFWLAWKIAFPKTPASSKGNVEQEKVPGIRDGFTLQFINPKVILFGFTAMSSFIAPWSDSKLMFLLCGLFLTLNCAVAFTIWSLFGDLQGRLFSKTGPPDLDDNGCPSGLVRVFGLGNC